MNQTFVSPIIFPTIVGLASLAMLATACDSEPSLCEQAAQHVQECFGTELGECNDALAEDIVGQTCEELAGGASPDEKADGSIFCPSFLWWICGDDLEVDCPSAGDEDYEERSAGGQLSYHWEWVGCTEYGTGDNPPLETSGWDLVTDAAAGVISSGLKLGRSFTNPTDELDRGRTKLFHPYGTVALVEFVANEGDPDPACNVAYSGVFAEPTAPGIARLSWGSDPRAIGYLPGVAIKFFIEGRPSANFHAVSGLAGTKGVPHFFEQPVSNVLDPDASVMGQLARLLGVIVENPDELRLTHLARFRLDGSTVADAEVRAPYRIFLEGADEALSLYNPDPGLDFRAVLGEFPAGTELYRVIALDNPGECRQDLGVIRTASEFRASQWGDERLYFQHPRENQEPIAGF